jgi:hypothetical protein
MTSPTSAYSSAVQAKFAQLGQDIESLFISLQQQIELNQSQAQTSTPIPAKTLPERYLQPVRSVPARVRQPLAA